MKSLEVSYPVLLRDVINVHCDEARLAFACEFFKCFVDYRKQPIFFIADKVLLPPEKFLEL